MRHDLLSLFEPLLLFLVPQENIPSNTAGAHTTATLATLLSSVLSASIERVILPPLFDPTNPPANTHPDDPAGQSEAFARSLMDRGGKPKRTPLPTGGGPYKGFAFVVVGSVEDMERILRDWTWEIPEKKLVPGRDGESEVDRIVREELKAMEAHSPMAKIDEDEPTKSDVELEAQKAARRSGLRTLS